MRSRASTGSPFLSVTAAAARLGLSPATGYRLAAAGELPTTRLGRRIIVPEDALNAWLASKATEALAAVGMHR